MQRVRWASVRWPRYLSRQGYRNAKGLPLTGSAVRTIVENPVYAGWLSWHERKSRRQPGE